LSNDRDCQNLDRQTTVRHRRSAAAPTGAPYGPGNLLEVSAVLLSDMIHSLRPTPWAALVGILASGLLASCAIPPGSRGSPAGGGQAAPVASAGHGTASASPIVINPLPFGKEPPSPGPTLVPAPGSQTLTVTAADAGRTARLRVGDTLTVELRGTASMPWEHLGNSNAAVLHPLPQLLGILQPVGTIWARFQAVAPGTAVVTATSVPACLSDHPACALPDRLFTLQVVVTAS